MSRLTPPSESSQSIPEMVDELTRQEIATWYKDGKLTPHGRQMAKISGLTLCASQRLCVSALKKQEMSAPQKTEDERAAHVRA